MDAGSTTLIDALAVITALIALLSLINTSLLVYVLYLLHRVKDHLL